MFIRLGAPMLAAVLASSAAYADDCAPVMAATRAAAMKPYSSTITITEKGGQPRTSHAVMTGAKMYVQVDGAWHGVPMGTKELLQEIDDNAKTAKTSCVRKGEEAVNGQPATMWSAHVVNKGNTSDNTIWIGRSGLPLKSLSLLSGGAVVVSVMDYDHYAVPPGAK